MVGLIIIFYFVIFVCGFVFDIEVISVSFVVGKCNYINLIFINEDFCIRIDLVYELMLICIFYFKIVFWFIGIVCEF